MAQGSASNRTLVREAASALDNLKYQIAHEIGVNPPADGYWGELPARQCGAVGGHIVRRLIETAEHQLAGGAARFPRP